MPTGIHIQMKKKTKKQLISPLNNTIHLSIIIHYTVKAISVGQGSHPHNSKNTSVKKNILDPEVKNIRVCINISLYIENICSFTAIRLWSVYVVVW